VSGWLFKKKLLGPLNTHRRRHYVAL